MGENLSETEIISFHSYCTTNSVPHMNHCGYSKGAADFLAAALIPSSLQNLCQTSLNLIENASDEQLVAAVDFNERQINTLLVQILAINFINTNRNTIEADVSILSNNNNTISTDRVEKSNSLQVTNSRQSALEKYCDHKLRALSPIHGFSRKNYFIECNISNDVQLEILSYLKPIEIFQNISLINKQFNKNVKTIHQCCKYSSIFCSKNFAFEYWYEVEDLWDQKIYDVDIRMENGLWTSGFLEYVDDCDDTMATTYSSVNGFCYSYSAKDIRIAPLGTMTNRPGNISRFVTILKHGYFSATCDVNLKDIYCEVGDEFFHLISGRTDDSNADFEPDVNGNTDSQDIWVCGWINFTWTWHEALLRNNENWKFAETSNSESLGNGRERNKEQNDNFGVFQIAVTVDITKAYNKHDNECQESIRDYELFDFVQRKNGQCLINLVFHIDDIENISYFGDKTTLEQQLEAKQRAYDVLVASYVGGTISPAQKNLLKAVGYPNYCVATPDGIFSAMSSNEEEQKQFNKWIEHEKDCTCLDVYDNECMNVQVSQNGVNKVYYDKIKDELLLKTLSWYEWVLEDENAPEPLGKRYIVPHGNWCRLIQAKIVDSKLIDKVRQENIDDINVKAERYFELLKEWKGFIKVSIDITNEFDQFQQRLECDYLAQSNCKEVVKWDPRKYFLQNVNYDTKENKITHQVCLLLDSKRVYMYDDRFNFFDTLEQEAEAEILEIVFDFVLGNDQLNSQFVLVCKKWCQIINSL